MVAVEAVFRYLNVPDESEMLAISKVREVYGIRRIGFDEKERTVTVEYDSTRLRLSDIARLLRHAGLAMQQAAAAAS